jgi:hypothetical protein
LPAVTSGPFAGVYAGGGRYNFSGDADDFANQFGFDFTHIFTPNLVLDLKAGYTRINNLSTPLNYGNNVDTAFGFGPNMNFNAQASGLTPIGINNFEDLGDGAYVPLNDIDNTFQYLGIVSWTKGNHNLKFGLNLIRRQAYNLQSASALGSFSFGLTTDSCLPGTGISPITGACTTTGSIAQQNGNVLASLLVGAFTDNDRNYDLYPPHYRTWEPGGFAQDTWRVKPNLTVIYGLRYDVYTPFTEAQGHIANFSYYQALASSPSTVDSALQVASVNGVSSTAGIKTFYSDVAPRVGFAYTLRPGTVLRGGYGITYFPGNYTSNTDLKNAPFTSNYAPNCESSLAYGIQIGLGQSTKAINGPCSLAGPTQAAFNTFAAGLPLPAPQTINSPGLSFIAESPTDQAARVQQYNLQIEQQFGPNVFAIGYVGNLASHLPEILNDINLPLPNATAVPRPLSTLLPNLSSVGWVTSEGISNYNSLQTSLQRRFSKGLSFDANYTWSRELNDITGFSEEGDQGYGNADPSNIRGVEYGVGENNISSRFALTLDYQIPYGQGFTGIKKQALGGWAVNTLSAWQSGKPFSIENGAGDGGFANRAQLINSPGNDRPDQIADPHLSHPTNAEWFNTAAFAPQPLGTVGNVQRNSLTGPRFSHVDVSLFKDFPIFDRVTLQFRAEAFNVFNHPSFIIPNTNAGNASLGNGSFGQITNVDSNYNPRELQFALRAEF